MSATLQYAASPGDGAGVGSGFALGTEGLAPGAGVGSTVGAGVADGEALAAADSCALGAGDVADGEGVAAAATQPVSVAAAKIALANRM